MRNMVYYHLSLTTFLLQLFDSVVLEQNSSEHVYSWLSCATQERRGTTREFVVVEWLLYVPRAQDGSAFRPLHREKKTKECWPAMESSRRLVFFYCGLWSVIQFPLFIIYLEFIVYLKDKAHFYRESRESPNETKMFGTLSQSLF